MTPGTLDRDGTNGRASIREVHALLTEVYNKMEADKAELLFAITSLDTKYVARLACQERHRWLDVGKIWAAIAVQTVLWALVLALVGIHMR